MSQLTPDQLVKLESISESASGVESTAQIVRDLFSSDRITINDPNLNERYVSGLLSGQIALAHLIEQSVEAMGVKS